MRLGPSQGSGSRCGKKTAIRISGTAMLAAAFGALALVSLVLR